MGGLDNGLKKRLFIPFAILSAMLVVLLAACGGETVEVEVTRIVEVTPEGGAMSGEGEVREVEVTRIVEVTPEGGMMMEEKESRLQIVKDRGT